MSNTIINKDIVEKIRKLLALGQSPNENEAKLAIERAQQLLLKYNLTISDVKAIADDVKENVVESGKRSQTWKNMLINIIAKYNYGEFLIYNGGGSYKYVIIAKEVNSIVIHNMYEYLVETIDRLAKTYPVKGIKAKNSYRLGLVSGLRARLEVLKSERENNGVNFEDGSQITALVVRDMEKQERQLVQNYIDDKIKGVKQRKVKNHMNVSDYIAGNADSAKINLNHQIA